MRVGSRLFRFPATFPVARTFSPRSFR
jgi:hypothetical protein